MARPLWMALLLVFCVGAAAANGRGAVRKQVESTMLLNGTIDLDAQGRVARYTLERQEKLPQPVAGLIARVVPQWRFEPVQVDGQATAVRSDMSLRLVAKKLDNGDYSLAIGGAQFHPAQPDAPTGKRKLAPPRYPDAAVLAGVGGTVYVVLKISPDGRVEDTLAEQVNLRIIATERQMGMWRELLAKAALRAAKSWTFDTPVDERDAPFWSARVPVDFVAPDQRPIQDHEWHAYVPGPRQPIPWSDDSSASTAADALGAGGVYPLNGGLRLLSALDPD